MNEKILFCIIFIFGVFISSISQIILKKSAQKKYENKIKEYLNPRVIFAYMIFVLCWHIQKFRCHSAQFWNQQDIFLLRY